ncbi:WYL domain-containing protein [Photobacterium profundum]|uniref:helix-turn-helix transcriptional regulator n=1 Tax=Photobacterium profundum TaxID=74109 RepID=UPI003D0E6D9E
METIKTSTADKIVLVLELYKRIPRSHKVTAKTLQTQLSDSGIKRDIRTIQRNLELLIEFFDVDKDDRDKPYGYSRRSNNILKIGPQEAILINLAESYLLNLLPASLTKAIQSTFLDAKQQLYPSHSNVKERQWLRKVKLISETQPLLPPLINQRVFENVSIALFNNRWLTLHYLNSHSEQTSHDVMPLGLVQQGTRLFLICRLKGGHNEQSLALHRISKATLSTFTFTYPADFNLALCDTETSGTQHNTGRVRLQFCITYQAGQYLYETPLSLDQHIEIKGDYLQVSATITDSSRLTRWLNSFGKDVFNVQKGSTHTQPETSLELAEYSSEINSNHIKESI